MGMGRATETVPDRPVPWQATVESFRSRVAALDADHPQRLAVPTKDMESAQ
jgi:hypothetical protein